MSRRITIRTSICTLVLASLAPAFSQISGTLNPLTGFGGADGWLAPGENGYTFLGTGSLERGLAYSSASNHLYLVSRNGGTNVRILNSSTGADLGGLNVTGITGGTFAANMISVGGDGAIYVGNLAANTSATVPYKIYKWADEISAPTTAFSSFLTAGIRIGDTLDAIGSGASTVLVAGFGNTTSGYLLVDPTTGTSSSVSIAGTVLGDFRSGISFAGDANTIWGDPGSPGVRRSSWSGTVGGAVSGSLSGTFTLSDVTERPLDVALINGVWVMATIEASTSLTNNNDVRLWDVTETINNPSLTNTRTLLATANLTGAAFLSSGGNGSLTWGAISGDTATLYAMSTNNGIQAFNVQIVPEPGAALLVGLGLSGLAARRRRV